MRVLDSELIFDYSGEGGGGNNDDNNDDVVVNNALSASNNAGLISLSCAILKPDVYVCASFIVASML